MTSAKKALKNNDFTITIKVPKSAKQVFDALKNVEDWWIGEIHGRADKVGAEFVYTYKEFHKNTQKVIDITPNQKVVWYVEDAHLSFTRKKDEWKGTTIVFEISSKGEQTQITFTHQGLTPKAECFEACSSGWEFYIAKSLRNYLLKGKGLDPGF